MKLVIEQIKNRIKNLESSIGNIEYRLEELDIQREKDKKYLEEVQKEKSEWEHLLKRIEPQIETSLQVDGKKLSEEIKRVEKTLGR